MFSLDTTFSIEENKSVTILCFCEMNCLKECYENILTY